MDIAKPVRWDIDNPAMYRAITVVKLDGRETDRYVTPFGIRTIAFNREQGFLLNGRRHGIERRLPAPRPRRPWSGGEPARDGTAAPDSEIDGQPTPSAPATTRRLRSSWNSATAWAWW